MWLPGDRKHPYFLGIVSGRMAVFEMKAVGPVLLGYLPIQTAAGQKEGMEVVVKDKPKEIEKRGEKMKSSEFDPKTGFAKFRFSVPTRSKTSSDLFRFDVVLKVKGSLSGTWRGYAE